MAVGLALAAFGAVAAVRAARGVWRVVTLLAVVAVVWLVVPTIAVAVAATHVPHADLGDRTPADLGLEYTDVTFRTPDDVRLSGLVPAVAQRGRGDPAPRRRLHP